MIGQVELSSVSQGNATEESEGMCQKQSCKQALDWMATCSAAKPGGGQAGEQTGEEPDTIAQWAAAAGGVINLYRLRHTQPATLCSSGLPGGAAHERQLRGSVADPELAAIHQDAAIRLQLLQHCSTERARGEQGEGTGLQRWQKAGSRHASMA